MKCILNHMRFVGNTIHIKIIQYLRTSCEMCCKILSIFKILLNLWKRSTKCVENRMNSVERLTNCVENLVDCTENPMNGVDNLVDCVKNECT